MIEWQFGESNADGEAWLRNPRHLQVYVDYRRTSSGKGGEWRRLTVVTHAWLLAHLEGKPQGAPNPPWVLVPTMLVMGDAEGESLRKAVDAAIRQGIFDDYASPIDMRSA